MKVKKINKWTWKKTLRARNAVKKDPFPNWFHLFLTVSHFMAEWEICHFHCFWKQKKHDFCQPRIYHHFCHLHCLLYLFQTFFAVALPQRLDFALKQGIGDLDIYIYHFWDKENTLVDKKQVSHRHGGGLVGPNFSFDFEVFLQSVIELRICVKKGKFKRKGKRSGLNHEKSILIYHLG